MMETGQKGHIFIKVRDKPSLHKGYWTGQVISSSWRQVRARHLHFFFRKTD
jgi:hypothetical protein